MVIFLILDWRFLDDRQCILWLLGLVEFLSFIENMQKQIKGLVNEIEIFKNLVLGAIWSIKRSHS